MRTDIENDYITYFAYYWIIDCSLLVQDIESLERNIENWLDQNMMMNTVLMMMIRAVLKGVMRTDEIKSDENRWGSTCQLGDRQTWSKEKWKNSKEPETHLRKTEKKFMNYKNNKTKKQVKVFFKSGKEKGKNSQKQKTHNLTNRL